MTRPAPVEGLDSATPLDEAARRLVAARLADVRQYEERLGGAPAPDDVHDMRVASRRLRAALALFDRRKQLREAHDAARALGDALGEVRELQVQQAWLGEAARSVGERERAGLEMLAAERTAKLPKRIDRLHAALARWTAEGAATVEDAIAGAMLPGRLGGGRVRKRVARRLKQVSRRGRAAHTSPDAHTAHRLRIAAKKLRYAAELAAPAFAEPLAPLIDVLQPLQETLGQLHDADVHLAVVEKFLVRADAVAQPGALVLLRGELARRDKLAEELARSLGELRHRRTLEELRDRLC